MAAVAASASPLRCRWIRRGSEMHIGHWSLALCDRLGERPRVVTEEECSHCALWQDEDGDYSAPGRENSGDKGQP